MAIEQIAALTSSGESEKPEFKETTGMRRETTMTICAFVNTDVNVIRVDAAEPQVRDGLLSQLTKSLRTLLCPYIIHDRD